MCGWLRDKFGMYWQVDSHRVTELMADSDREKAQRAFNAMMKMKKIVIADMENAAEGAAARH
jgi:predicted 3-demethylubiquinone-9 3-methyltransferase (glyoxalase superfamily)